MKNLTDSLPTAGLYSLAGLLVLGTGVQVLRLYIGNLLTRRPDPHLGRKIALHLIASVGVVLLLGAFSYAAVDLAGKLTRPPGGPVWWDDTLRVVAGLAVAGASYWLAAEATLLLATNDRHRPRVRRSAAGTRFVGLAVGCMYLTASGCIAAFLAAPPEATTMATFGALAGLWFPAAGLHFWLMTRPDADDAEPR